MNRIDEEAEVWQTWEPNCLATLLFVVNRETEEVLLIRKKRGLGAGKMNGPGGKVDEGEDAMQCVKREVEEELCIRVQHPQKHGELSFDFTNGLKLYVDVFLAFDYEGEPQETEEAIPHWVKLRELPLMEMWEDDQYWLPQLLETHGKFKAKFHFEEEKMLSRWVRWE